MDDQCNIGQTGAQYTRPELTKSNFSLMKSKRFFGALVGACCGVTLATGLALGQAREQQQPEQFGPVVTAYLGYLRNEQEVVDDRVSRREISRAYYRRNSNRIRALREIAMRIARERHNDYLPA